MADVEEHPFAVGLVYEDCFFHPVLCTYLDVDGDEMAGISLIDGSGPRGCSLRFCAPVPLSIPQVVWIREHFADYVERRTAGQTLTSILPSA